VRQVLANVPDVEAVTFDAGERAVTAIAAPEPPATGRGADASGEMSKSLATLRVRADLLDDIMDSIGELFIARERLRLLAGDAIHPDLRSAVDGLGNRIRQLHDQVIQARMTPMRTLTDRYPRLVRDLCRSLGKDVELEVRGRDIEIDRAILDNLDAPLIHTLRNAVDHGIEAAAVRAGRRKPAAGRVTISATRDRDSVLVMVEDDGAGLDPERLREVAVARGLISAEQAAALSLRDAHFLICLPGFSTKSEVSDISGRGVGMDVVAERIEALGGSLVIESERERGTRFIFRLPQTLAIIPVLLVRSGGSTFAVPIAKVVAVREAVEEVLPQPDGSRYLAYQHGLLPIVSLAGLLRLQRVGGPEPLVVVLEVGPDLHALGIDGVVGYREVVVKSLGEPLESLEWFAGATLLGDGQPILILDVARTLKLRSAA
ncbi:MAG TPA: chemotaxis protein CheA, partial [Myxococcota bacterium]|nr:chemotaxis protein CheA [Myxococcota bacterium]